MDADRPMQKYVFRSPTGVVKTVYHSFFKVTETKKTTIYRGRSTRSLSKEIMRNCYAKVGVTSSARNMTALSKFKSEIDKRLIKESTKQPTNTDKSLATPAYRFIVRKSLFPNPKHCNFFHRHGRKYSIIRPQQKSKNSQKNSH